MREFKFRAWDKENKKFFEPTFSAYKGKLEELHLALNGRLGLRGIKEMIDESLFPGRFVLQQYTNLKDKNGQEICEGDIVDSHHTRNYLIKWYEIKAAFRIFVDNESTYPICFLDDISDCVVIGNIYENPELLTPLHRREATNQTIVAND